MSPNPLRRANHLFWIASIPVLAGCGNPAYRSNIQAPFANDRILAIREAGERRDREVIPLLVDRLEDEDAAVRFYAILALERITGDRLGYRYEGNAADRRDAVERWRRYAAGSREASVDSQAASTQPSS